MSKKIRVGLIGLGFGAEFIPIYQNHPNAEVVAICQRDPAKLAAIGEAFGVARRYTDWRALIQDADVDAVHINSPIPDHAAMSLAALEVENTAPAPCPWRPILRHFRRSAEHSVPQASTT